MIRNLSRYLQKETERAIITSSHSVEWSNLKFFISCQLHPKILKSDVKSNSILFSLLLFERASNNISDFKITTNFKDSKLNLH